MSPKDCFFVRRAPDVASPIAKDESDHLHWTEGFESSVIMHVLAVFPSWNEVKLISRLAKEPTIEPSVITSRSDNTEY